MSEVVSIAPDENVKIRSHLRDKKVLTTHSELTLEFFQTDSLRGQRLSELESGGVNEHR